MLTLLWLLPTATADIPPVPPPSKQFTSHSVRVDGIPAGPMVLVLHDTSDTIRGYTLFDAKNAEHTIASGHTNRQNSFSAPKLFAMTRDAYEAYDALAMAEASRQREDCMNGVGCAHISRFSPSFAPPTGGIPCGADIQVTTTTEVGGADAFIDVFTVEALSADTCRLAGPTRTSVKNGEPTGAVPDATPNTTASAGCASVAAASGATWGLSLLLLGWRRSRAALP